MPTAAEQLARHNGLVVPNRITEGITHRQLARVLKEAAAEAEKEMLRIAATNGTRAVQLAQARAAMSEVSREMWNGTGNVIRAGVYTQAQVAAEQALDLDLLSGVPASAVEQMAPYFRYNAAQAVEDIISRRTDGFTLSERIYANGRVSTKQVGRIIDKALGQQLSARELAKQVKGFYSPGVPGGASYAAMRLARTEINNAHHTTTIRLTQDKPWVTGYKWNLSGSHPKPDECNEYADHNGDGTWTKNEVPSKPHPQCLCYLTMTYPDDAELIDNIANGRYDGYLEDNGVTC